LEQTISLLQVLAILRKHIKVILGTAAVITLGVVFITFFLMTPKYSATTGILVNHKSSEKIQGVQFQQVQADVQMISTYKDIITSPTILKDVNRVVNDYPGYPGSIVALENSLSINNSQNSQIFSITAKSTDAATAAAIANMTAKVFKKKIGKIMSVDNVSIVSKAETNTKQVSPHNTLNILAGVVLGSLLGIALAFIFELTDRTVTSDDFIADELALTNLGIVSEISQKDIEKNSKQSRAREQLIRTDITNMNGIKRV